MVGQSEHLVRAGEDNKSSMYCNPARNLFSESQEHSLVLVWRDMWGFGILYAPTFLPVKNTVRAAGEND